MTGKTFHYEEIITREKRFRYCLKIIDTKSRDKDVICVDTLKDGKLWLSPAEDKKLGDHITHVVTSQQKIHKDIVWTLILGHAPITRAQVMSSESDTEKNVEEMLAERFLLRNPLTWNKSVMTNLDSSLYQKEVNVDGIIGVFALESSDSDQVNLIIRNAARHCVERFGSRFLNRVIISSYCIFDFYALCVCAGYELQKKWIQET